MKQEIKQIVGPGMNTLSPLEYDAAEKAALNRVANRMIEAAQTHIFDRLGYPTRVATDLQLYRYLDATGETLFDERFAMLVGRLTAPEFDLWQKVWARALTFGEQEFGKAVLPRATLAGAMNVLRHIRFVYGAARPKVLEVGPGSGHFGALMILDDYPYAATDITQALYLVQNHYWQHLTSGEVVETARTSNARQALWSLSVGKPVHLPWWEFMQLVPGEVPKLDLIVANHMLCEMHDHSLRYLMAFAREALQGAASDRKLIMFEGWGHSSEHDRERAVKLFLQFGFRMVHHDLLIAVFAPVGSRDAENCLEYPVRTQGQVANFNVQGQIELQTVVNESYASVFYENPLNPVSRLIQEGRASIESQKVVDLWQVVALATSLLGTEDHRTDDEKFWDIIGLQAKVLPANQPT